MSDVRVKMQPLARLACVLMLPAVLGCSGLQHFSIRNAARTTESQTTSSTFVIASVTQQVWRQNLTLGENLQWGAPAHPKNGWMCDMTVSVDRVLKGAPDSVVLTFRNLGPASIGTAEPWPSLAAKRYYIGWTKGASGRYHNLLFIPYEEDGKP